ncbi:hypothetical protein RclHR1_00610006 [Rhizophagus clarus]|uniref:Uncharacterized protein n=1 Tax=Rhizophagus clarus TaxID=94130 RepID=A0A2Z6RRA7_9GLOM|nr:hypothetical protein RclHR1_00610006 [Rhizophagus clarus]GES75961.1 hypothetical protein GLOIN_2v1883501 [Rhizophagus clarus]
MVFAENKRSTEPYSFILLKKLCSFILIILLVYYTYGQFLQYYQSIFKPNITFRKQYVNEASNTHITVRICGPSVDCTYNGQDKCRVAVEIPTENIRENSFNCSRYSFDYREKIDIAITPSVTEIYLDGLEITKYYPAEISSLFFMNERTTIVYYSPTIIKRIFRKYAYGLAGGEVEEYVNFNVHTDITTLPTPNTTLVLRPKTMDVYYQEETYYDLGSIISSIGGFFSSLSGIFVFLFGASKLAPWGFLQIHVFKFLCVKYQRRLVKGIESQYESIPFINGRIIGVTLEERVQSIENLLEEYYLNTEFLHLLLEDDNKVDNIV